MSAKTSEEIALCAAGRMLGVEEGVVLNESTAEGVCAYIKGLLCEVISGEEDTFFLLLNDGNGMLIDGW